MGLNVGALLHIHEKIFDTPLYIHQFLFKKVSSGLKTTANYTSDDITFRLSIRSDACESLISKFENGIVVFGNFIG